MRKTIAILLAVLLLLAIAACGGKTESAGESGSSATETEESSQPETDSSKPEDSSKAEAAKPAQEEPKKERWVRVLEECNVSDVEAQMDGYGAPGDVWMSTMQRQTARF